MGILNDSNLAVSPVFWCLLGTGIAVEQSIKSVHMEPQWGCKVPLRGFLRTKSGLSTYIYCKGEVNTIRKEAVQNLLTGNIRTLLKEAEPDYEKLYEIRLRVGRPVFLIGEKGEHFLKGNSGQAYLVTADDLRNTLEYISGYSLYAYEDELRQGYLSIQGGHRVGVTGKVILGWRSYPGNEICFLYEYKAGTSDSRLCRPGDAFHSEKRLDLPYPDPFTAQMR